MPNVPAKLLEALHRYPPAIQSLTLGARSVVLQELGPCRESIYDMRLKAVLFYSATERVFLTGVCYISPFSHHVTLGFVRGTDLADPTRALRGSGKRMRHVQLRRLSDLDRADLRALLRQAAKLAGIRRRPGEQQGTLGDSARRPAKLSRKKDIKWS